VAMDWNIRSGGSACSSEFDMMKGFQVRYADFKKMIIKLCSFVELQVKAWEQFGRSGMMNF